MNKGKKNKKKNKSPLDQFYTKPEIAEKYYKITLKYVKKYTNIDSKNYFFLEPSAGTGAFFNLMDKKKRFGFDIDPKDSEIVKKDFLTTTHTDIPELCITIGNPPFGKRSKLAIEFFNHSAKFSNVIAMIVPLQFRKWSVQSKLEANFRLIYDTLLDENSFIFNNKPFNVNCCFQIWTKDITTKRNLRLLKKPPIKHPDFNMWQYNNTKQALSVFDNDFDFAVPRQGYYDYERKEVDKNKCEKHIQWILFKAHSKESLNKLLTLNFKTIAKKNTSTPGFGKADVVEHYNKKGKK